MPTVLAAAGLKPPENSDGLDFLPALRGEAKLPNRSWFSYLHQSEDAHASVHEGKWKLVVHGDAFTEKPATAPVLELYDLDRDPAEQTDLKKEHPEVVARLQAQLREFGKLHKPGVGAYAEGRSGFRVPKDWVIQE